MKIKNLIFTSFAMFTIIFAFYVKVSAQEIDPYKLTLAQLGKIQCYTASRELTSIEAAPSVITVITAEEIKQHGFRSLSDVLERVPGFISYADSYTHIFGHRGFVEDAISNYLLMIDGYKQNNQLFSIGNQAHLFMPLSHVKRIEVVRDPGSTLWGSDASAGIINIITFNGTDLHNDQYGKWQITVDAEFKNKRYIGNILYGADFGDAGNVMVSLNYSQSNGEWLPAYHADTSGYVPWSIARPWDPRWNLSGIYGPNYDFYSKYRNGDFILLTQYSQTKPARFQYSDKSINHAAEWPRLHWSADLRYNPQVGTNLLLETSLFFDRHEGYLITPPTTKEDFNYNTFGSSATFTHRFNANRVKTGIAYEMRNYTGKYLFKRGPGKESVCGIFLEENYFGIEDWTITAGIRYDYNSLRSRGGNVSPRVSVFYRINENWSAKYVYNTGHVRPSIRKYRTFSNKETFADVRSGAPWVGVEYPQSTSAHDMQLNYKKDDISLSLVLFDMTIKNYATYIGYTYYNTPEEQARTGWYGYEYIDQNLGDLNSRGIELELFYIPLNTIDIYGNATFSCVKLSNRYITMQGGLHTIDIVTEPDMDLVNYDLEKTGWPKYIWNLGADIEPFDGHLFNFHYRGWTDNPVKAERQPNEFDIFGPEHFIDVNYVTTLFNMNSDVSIYVKNILDNKAKYPAPNDGGYTVNMGRIFGISCKLRL